MVGNRWYTVCTSLNFLCLAEEIVCSNKITGSSHPMLVVWNCVTLDSLPITLIATPYSPDLNSIMHARDMLQTSINTMQLNNSVMNSPRTCLDRYNNVAASTLFRRHATSERSCYTLFLTLWHFSLDSRATVIIGLCVFCLCLYFRSKWTKRRNKEFFHRF